ncbi:MAG TPA: bifunctional pyr operon transcriptional regulator/uracil phosphoribosyltransferase PyrR [Candidatus Saccharicenans sp.]|mgnify:FL=1|nr:bifunctional pyr operon transcriptional regulator/uracil phosphoribosyltransferase PyrR [Candidatus Saccharicenans sp.]HQO75844.1 bifunctional pyr operon transcriptional regulator/uracil phosphoribosyltransferase PyrR [Candidatus Saccharicenans sp.]HUM79715.1 bifunctional pyr operon transcriptional regulator/uracil phosphoribosyltransferase PyrR [Candidatus Saccharicenans sp.]
MEAKIKARIMDSGKIRRTLVRMATEIAERNRELDNLVIIGVKTRGHYLGQRLADILKQNEGVEVPVRALDITPYRDDLDSKGKKQKPDKAEIDIDLDGKDVVLVDDVIFTGRTSRAAMEAIFDLGRPRTIQLAVFIDRGHRELPIRPDYTGRLLPTSRRERVEVHLKEIDQIDEVLITEPKEALNKK